MIFGNKNVSRETFEKTKIRYRKDAGKQFAGILAASKGKK